MPPSHLHLHIHTLKVYHSSIASSSHDTLLPRSPHYTFVQPAHQSAFARLSRRRLYTCRMHKQVTVSLQLRRRAVVNRVETPRDIQRSPPHIVRHARHPCPGHLIYTCIPTTPVPFPLQTISFVPTSPLLLSHSRLRNKSLCIASYSTVLATAPSLPILLPRSPP